MLLPWFDHDGYALTGAAARQSSAPLMKPYQQKRFDTEIRAIAENLDQKERIRLAERLRRWVTQLADETTPTTPSKPEAPAKAPGTDDRHRLN